MYQGLLAAFVKGDRIPSPRVTGIRNDRCHLGNFAARVTETRNDCALVAALYPDQMGPGMTVQEG